MQRVRKSAPTLLLLAIPILFLAVFFIVPLLNSVFISLELPNATSKHYERLVEVPVYRAVYIRTLWVAVVTTLICLLCAYPCAYFVSRLDPARRNVVIALVAFPFMLSVLVRNYVWITLLQNTGLVNSMLLDAGLIDRPLRLMYNETGVLIAMVNMLVPYIFFPVLSALLAMPRDLEEASASLGAGALRTFARVVAPLTLGGTAAGCLLVFIVALGFYITPAMLGGTQEMMISNVIAFNVREVLNWSLAFALSTTLLASTLLLYFIYRSVVPGGAVLRPI